MKPFSGENGGTQSERISPLWPRNNDRCRGGQLPSYCAWNSVTQLVASAATSPTQWVSVSRLRALAAVAEVAPAASKARYWPRDRTTRSSVSPGAVTGSPYSSRRKSPSSKKRRVIGKHAERI